MKSPDNIIIFETLNYFIFEEPYFLDKTFEKTLIRELLVNSLLETRADGGQRHNIDRWTI